MRPPNQLAMELLVERVVDCAIFMLDVHGVIESWNPGAQRMKGYTEAEAVGKHFSLLYMEENARAGVPDRNLQIAAQYDVFKEEGPSTLEKDRGVPDLQRQRAKDEAMDGLLTFVMDQLA